MVNRGHRGAAAIRFWGAPGGSLEDININATGAYAGILDLPGTGGGVYNLSVTGGDYGISITRRGFATIAGARFIDALDLIVRLVNIGDARSLACHPASTTHRQLNAEELAKAGVSEDMVRLSIGIEHVDDILADVEQALAAAI